MISPRGHEKYVDAAIQSMHETFVPDVNQPLDVNDVLNRLRSSEIRLWECLGIAGLAGFTGDFDAVLKECDRYQTLDSESWQGFTERSQYIENLRAWIELGVVATRLDEFIENERIRYCKYRGGW